MSSRTSVRLFFLYRVDAESVGTCMVLKYLSLTFATTTVFFGESLPNRFHQLLRKDLREADLLMVMGTSLQVAPVSLIPEMVKCNRVLFNRDMVMRIGRNDIFVPGDCDENVRALADLLGWGEALAEAIEACQLRKDGDDDEKQDECKATTDNGTEATLNDAKNESAKTEEEN
jgi:Sir2 family